MIIVCLGSVCFILIWLSLICSLLITFDREIISTTKSKVFCLRSSTLLRWCRQRIKLDFRMSNVWYGITNGWISSSSRIHGAVRQGLLGSVRPYHTASWNALERISQRFDSFSIILSNTKLFFFLYFSFMWILLVIRT
jgi:hypothetical protein